MAWVAPFMAAAARIATRPRRTHTSAADDQIFADELLSKLSDAARHITHPSPTPTPGARPLLPDRRHYNLLIKAFSRAGLDNEVLRLYNEMRRSADCKPNLPCYTTVIDALVASRRLREAESVYEDMIKARILPDVTVCTVMVKLYSDSINCFDSAVQACRSIERRGCRPDVVTYSMLIAWLCKAGRLGDAKRILDKMLEGNCAPNTQTYTPILQHYCSHGHIRDVRRLLESMRRSGCRLDTVAYNIFIQALCKIGSFGEIENLLLEDWEPSAVTYNIYINGLCKAGRSRQAIKQLEIMLGKGLNPTSTTLNILLDLLCNQASASEVKCLLERSGELGLRFDVVSYNTVMCRLSEDGNWISVLKLFTDMMKKGIYPDTRTFNIVINSLCKGRQLYRAKCVFNCKGFTADIVTYNTLIHGFYAVRQMKDHRLLLSDMYMGNIPKDKVTLCTYVDLICRNGRLLEAVELVRFLEFGFSQDLIAHLAHWLVLGGMHRKLLRLFDEMREKDVVLDGQVYDYLIKAFCKRNSCKGPEIHEVCLVLDHMLGIG